VADNFKPNNNNNNNNILARKSYWTLFLVYSKPSEPEVVIQQVHKFLNFWTFLENCEKWLPAASCVCLPAHMEQLKSHWTDFNNFDIYDLFF
jgi:hypothetical protein